MDLNLRKTFLTEYITNGEQARLPKKLQLTISQVVASIKTDKNNGPMTKTLD